MTGLGSWLLLLALPFAWLEWRRHDTRNRSLRLGLALLIPAALAWLASPAPPSAEVPGTEPAGVGRVTDLGWPTEIDLGQPVQLTGRVTLAPGDTALVLLEGPGGEVDSFQVGGDQAAFECEDTPRTEGGAEYRLSVRLHGATVAAETLGVAVRRPTPPDLLILDGSPSFETTWLKRWLAARGGRATIRTSISRGRTRTEQVNGASANPNTLTSALLAEYSALLADASALRALTRGERVALHEAIRESGLGLLVTADVPAAITGGEPLLAGIRVRPGGNAAGRTARVRWSGAPPGQSAAVEVESQRLSLPRGAEVLATDEAGGALAARWTEGLGQVALTLVRTPSRWMLDGDPARFASYWAMLLAAVARDTATRVAVHGVPPRVDHRTVIEVISSGPRPTVLVVAPDGSADTLALARDPFDPRRLTGSYWPRIGGWHAVRLASRDVPFRVSAGAPAPGEATGGATRGAAQPRQLLGFAVLLIALGVLWAESRLTTGR